jgi:hypothetical protein
MLTIRETTECRQATQVYVDDTGQMSLTVENGRDLGGRSIVVPMTLTEVQRLVTSLSLAAATMRRAGAE